MESRWGRVARGWSAAAVATLAAAVSHTAAGGVPPTLFGMLASLLLAATLSTILTSRTLSLWRLGASMAASQMLFHALFSGVGMPVLVDHEHTPTLGEVLPMNDHGSMWVAHVIAGLVTLVLFRYAEAVFWGLRGTARRLLARLVTRLIPVTVVARPALAPRGADEAARGLILVSSWRDRGPPRGVFAA